MKHLSFIKSFTKADWKAFVGFTLLNIIHFILYPFSWLMIADCFKDVFPPNYPPHDFFKIPSLAKITAHCIIAVFISILASLIICKIQVWLLSLPAQFVLGCLVLYLLYSDVIFSVKLIGYHILAQAIGVFIGLYVRKRRNRKQAPPAT